MKKIIPVILAGGQGSRLWPASLPHIPKQFLTIGGVSLMEAALERAFSVTKDDILIITHHSYMPLFSEKISLNAELASRIHLIGEPAARNTAPAIALACQYVSNLYDDAILLVITADHIILPIDEFVKNVQLATRYAEKGSIVTFGIPPTKAETGYGYIEYELSSKQDIYAIRAFHEKPNQNTAENYIKQGNFLWNSGMFCFSLKKMQQEIKTHSPSIAESIFQSHEWTSKVENHIRYITLKNIESYMTVIKQSIDYAVMEHIQNAFVIPASFSWNDIGSWDEAAELQNQHEKVENDNSLYLVNSKNVSVFSDIPVGICEVSDIVVVVKTTNFS